MLSSVHLVFCSLLFLSTAEGEYWYIANNAVNEEDCGRSPDHPCADIIKVIQQCQDGDNIILKDSTQPYQLCGIEEVLEIQKSLSMSSTNGNTKIGCPSVSPSNIILKFSGSERTLNLTNITITNGSIALGNGTLNVNNVNFENAFLNVTEQDCMELSISVTNSKWENLALCNERGDCQGRNNLKCESVTVELTNCHFHASTVNVHGPRYVNVMILSTEFDGARSSVNAIEVVLFNAGEVHVKGSTFKHFMHPTLFQYVQNLHRAALQVRVRYKVEGTMNVTVKECSFISNERALSIIGDFRKVLIADCSFENNVAMHSAAAILAFGGKMTDITISNSVFNNNKGGNIKRAFKVKEPGETVSIEGDTVELNTTTAIGSIEAIGRGGAIRLQQGKMKIVNCKFHRNTANIQGGTIMSDMNTKLILENVYVEGPERGYQPLLGDILYSRGSTELNNVHFFSQQGKLGLSILEHVGQHWSIKVSGIRADCPLGHSIRLQEVSAFGVTGSGIQSSTNKFDELTYHCDACPKGQYSLDHGFVNNTLLPDSGYYLSFKVGSGDLIQPHYFGEYTYHHIQCIPCSDDHMPDEENYFQTVHLESKSDKEGLMKLKREFIRQCPLKTSGSMKIRFNLLIFFLNIAIAMCTYK